MHELVKFPEVKDQNSGSLLELNHFDDHERCLHPNSDSDGSDIESVENVSDEEDGRNIFRFSKDLLAWKHKHSVTFGALGDLLKLLRQ